MPTANAPVVKPNNYDTAFRPILRNPGHIVTDRDFNLYFQAVNAANSYSVADVEALLAACTDEEKVKLPLYYRHYVDTTKDRAIRSKNDKDVIAIAMLFWVEGERAKAKFTIVND